MAFPAHTRRLDSPAPYSYPVAAGFANTDLTAVPLKPDHAAQVVDFKNEGSEAQTVTWTSADGETLSRVLASGAEYTPLSPVASLDGDNTDANISAICYWWPTLFHTINPAP